MSCIFCDVAAHRITAHIVYEDDDSVAFLDHRPLFPGHVLLIPARHIETYLDLPPEGLRIFFTTGQLIAAAVLRAMDSDGVFTAINNRVSQSVPHLHMHIVPRKKGDGLRGFFWPRKKYAGDEEMAATAEAIRRHIS